MSTGSSMVPMARPPSTSSIPATIGPPKSAEMAEKEPAVERTAVSLRPEADEERHRHADDGAERDHGHLGAEDGAEAERAERCDRDARGVGDRRGVHAQPLDRRVAAVAR